MKRERPFAEASIRRRKLTSRAASPRRTVARGVTRSGEEARRRTQGVADEVAQRGVAYGLIDAVALAKTFDVNDGLAHDLATMHFNVNPP